MVIVIMLTKSYFYFERFRAIVFLTRERHFTYDFFLQDLNEKKKKLIAQ